MSFPIGRNYMHSYFKFYIDSQISRCSAVSSSDFLLPYNLNRFENYSFVYLGREQLGLGDVMDSFLQGSYHLRQS